MAADESILPQLSFVGALCAGAVAGTSVDVALYPIDTVKTRLQSRQGFRKAGGFRRIYSGIGSVLIGSSPAAAVFFASYEWTKSALPDGSAAAHTVAGAVGEVCACSVRVPTELVKQRSQANNAFVLCRSACNMPATLDCSGSSLAIARAVLHTEGLAGFYRGYVSTVVRDVPFAMLQLPVWEWLKAAWARRQGSQCNAVQAALCGSVAGVLAAAVTTPLDLAKTRIMLADRRHGHARGNMLHVIYDVYEVDGLRALYKGGATRSLWIGIGGFIFFGAFEATRLLWLRQTYGEQQVREYPPLADYVTETLGRLFVYSETEQNAREREKRQALTFEERNRRIQQAYARGQGSGKVFTKEDIGCSEDD